jgi:hypothetical protein
MAEAFGPPLSLWAVRRYPERASAGVRMELYGMC